MTHRLLPALALVLAALVAGCTDASPARERCAQCGMYVDLAPGWIAGTTGPDGRARSFDSPKCLLRWSRSAPGRGAHDAWVTEYYTQERRPLDGVVFVVGSDLTSPMGADLVPLADAEKAARFAADHGGRPVPASAVDDALLASLDAR